MMKFEKQIYIHIGLPKSGSTSIQAFLGANTDFLKKLGYDLFPSRVLHDEICACLISKKVSSNKLIFQKKKCSSIWKHFEEKYKRDDRTLELMRKELLEFIESSHYNKIIFSCEHLSSFLDLPFFPLEKTVANEICSIFKPFKNITVICVFRNQLDFLTSLFKNWSLLGSPIRFADFYSELLPHCNWFKIWKNYHKILPEAEFRGIILERCKKEGLLSSVLREMGIIIPSQGLKLVNFQRNVGLPAEIINWSPVWGDQFGAKKNHLLLRNLRMFAETYYSCNRKKHDANLFFTPIVAKKLKESVSASNKRLLNDLNLNESGEVWNQYYTDNEKGDNCIDETLLRKESIKMIGACLMEYGEKYSYNAENSKITEKKKKFLTLFVNKFSLYGKKVAFYGAGSNCLFILRLLNQKQGFNPVIHAVIDDWPGISLLHIKRVNEVKNAGKFNCDEVDFIVVTSLSHEKVILKKLIRRGIDRKKIITLSGTGDLSGSGKNFEIMLESELSRMLKDDKLEDVLFYIETLYKKQRSIRNAYARLGNIFRAEGKYEKAFELFERDRIYGRLSPCYRQILAFILAKLKRNHEAKEEIERAFLEDPSLLYGYHLVDINSGLPIPENGHYCESDVSFIVEGMTSEELVYLSERLSQNEWYEKAAFCVERAYDMDLGLKDRYAYIGNICRAFARFENALSYFEKDYEHKRLSHKLIPVFALLLVHAGLKERAQSVVYSLYEADRAICDGFSMIGSFFRVNEMFDTAFKYYDEDCKLERMTPAHRHIYADQLMRKGEYGSALNQVRKGYQQDPSLLNGYARIGNILKVHGKAGEAEKLYRKDRIKNRLTIAHWCNYIELLLNSQKYEEAVLEMGKVLEQDSRFKKSRLIPSWIMKISLKFAEYGNVDYALELSEYLYKRYPETDNVFSKLALVISDLSPGLAKGCFKKDFLSSRQTWGMTGAYLKYLLDSGLNMEARQVWDNTKKDCGNELISETVSQDFDMIKFQGRRLYALEHNNGCPAVLISFPRSGSNFLQNVLSESSGCASSSIYSVTNRFSAVQNVTLKSHAVDYEHLQKELQHFRISCPPVRVIVLLRDPRDIMRSFLEYVNVNRKINLSPGFFLNNCSYGYAAGLPGWSMDQTSKSKTVSEAFRGFVEAWIGFGKKTQTEVLTVFYEDLCMTPKTTFAKLFDFLGLNCELDMNVISKKVSLYSKEQNRPRATPYTWKKEGTHSHEIYKLVGESYRDYIDMLCF